MRGALLHARSVHILDRAFYLFSGQRPVIVEVGDDPLHEGLGKRDRAILVAEMIVENGQRQLPRARAFVGPLEAPFGELFDFVVLGQPTAIDRDFQTVEAGIW
jgi:hypothetical protein